MTTRTKKRRRSAISGVQWITLIIVAAFVIVPFYTTALGGFKEIGELRVNPFGLPASWDPVRFVEILGGPRYFSSLGNSLLIAAGTVALSTLVASMTAFALAHIKFFGSKFILGYLMLGLLFPAATGILPLFIKVRDIGLLDTYWAVILPQTAFSLSLAILLFRTFFAQLPKELFEAAYIDGCGYVRFFWRFTLPLSAPILATVGTFVFVQSWNNFLLPLVVLNSRDVFTWPLGMMQFRGEYVTQWNLTLAFVTLTILPAIVFFLAAQKYIVAGLTGGAVKG